MGRYARILLMLALLALVYSQQGGFASTREDNHGDATPNEASLPQPTPSALGALAMQTPLSAAGLGATSQLKPATDHWGMGGPDDGAETVTIARDESFYQALQRVGLPHETIMGLVNACKPHTDLRRVQRGDEFLLAREQDGAFRSLRFDVDPIQYLSIEAVDDEFQTELQRYPIDRVVRGVRGTIESSLFEALVSQGADPSLAGAMADILGWDIDFFRDLRKGDTFSLLIEEYRHDDKKVRDSMILAAEFVNQNKAHRAFLFENELELPAYYDENGNSLEKQFLRAPLKFSRVSSGFSRRRLHPVLKRHMPHYGVDYAAPKGTPVLATANGIVIKRERARGYGNYVGLRHGQTYESYYLHMSRFPSSLRVGDKVKQGDVIGYVGSTGLSTAPHLDYRVKKNGTWVDPRKLKLPPAAPVPEVQREEFAHVWSILQQRLDAIPASNRVVELDGVRSFLELPDPLAATVH